MEICEAQSAVNQLNPVLFGATIVGVEVASWYIKARNDHLSQMVGWTFSGVSRRGKGILFEFQNAPLPNRFLMSRLGMAGHWLLNPPSAAWRPVVTFILSTPRGALKLHYCDKKRSGTLELADSDRFEALGPDPLSDQFSADWLLACAKRYPIPIKALLMRPEYFPGVGNWVANEALFRAAVSPLAPAWGLTLTQAERVASSLVLTIRNGIAKGGASLKDWRNPDGSPGRAQEDFAVYGRDGRRCLVCQGKIKKTQVLERATFMCEICQTGVDPVPVSAEFVEQIIKATEGIR